MHSGDLGLFTSENTPIYLGLTKILRGHTTFYDEPFSIYKFWAIID